MSSSSLKWIKVTKQSSNASCKCQSRARLKLPNQETVKNYKINKEDAGNGDEFILEWKLFLIKILMN